MGTVIKFILLFISFKTICAQEIKNFNPDNVENAVKRANKIVSGAIDNKCKEKSSTNKLLINFTKLGGTPKALKQALCFFNKHSNSKFYKKINGKLDKNVKTQIDNKDFIVIQDFTLPSNQKRFFLLNLITNEIKVYYSSTGYGVENGYGINMESHSKNFSNAKGSYLTPRGFLISAERHNGSSYAWKWHMKYDGVQKNLNDNSRDRLIVYHQGVKSDNFENKIVPKGFASSTDLSPILRITNSKGEEVSKYYNPQMYSNGCTTVSSEHVDEIYEKTKGRSLTYNFTQHENELGEDYCGDDSMVIK